MKILLGDFNAKGARENIFKPTIGNDSLHQGGNDNGVRIVNFATSKNLVIKSTILPHRSIHEYTWINRKTHNQIDHILLDRRWHSIILDVRSFWGADCVIDRYLVVAKFGKRLAVIKPTTQKFDVERFNHRMLNELEVRKQYQIKISNRYAALENLSYSEDINRAWDNIKENIKKSSPVAIEAT